MAYEYTIDIRKTIDDDIPDSIGWKRKAKQESELENFYAQQQLAVEESSEKRGAIVGQIVNSQVKQFVSYGLSNVGKWSGNSYNQVRVNDTIQGVSLVQSIANSPAIGISQAAFNIAISCLNEINRVKQENRILKVERAKNGYTDTKSILTSRRHY